MRKSERILFALRNTYPGDKSGAGVNFSQAAKDIGVSRQMLVNWTTIDTIDIRTSNMNQLCLCTNVNREWIDQEIGPIFTNEKVEEQRGNYAACTPITTTLIPIFKWHDPCLVLDSNTRTESKYMPITEAIGTNAFAVELEFDIDGYASTGETLVIDPDAPTHHRRALVNINGILTILRHDKILDKFYDLQNNLIEIENPRILGTIVTIFGAKRQG